MKFTLFIDAAEFGQAAGDADIFAGKTIATLGERNDKGYLLQIGCADKWIAESGGNCQMLRQHSALHVIGEITGIHTAGAELKIGAGEFYEGIQAAGETRILIQRKALEGFSIGFDADPSTVTLVDIRDSETGRWTFGADFSEIQIVETSVVLSPGDKTAMIQAAGDGLAALAKFHRHEVKQDTSEEDDMSGVTIDLIKDAVDKRIEQAETKFTEQIDAKFEALDNGIENQITQAMDKARAATKDQPKAWKQFEKNGQGAYRCAAPVDLRYEQGANYASPTTGGPTTSDMPIPNYQEANFLRPYVRTIPVDGAAVNVPKLAAIAFAAKGNIGAGAAETGGLTDGSSNIVTYTAKVTMPTEMDMDVPGFRNAIGGQFMRAWQAHQLKSMLDSVKGVAAARQVNTGVAADWPAADSRAPKVRELMNKVGREYWMDGDMLLALSPYGDDKLVSDIAGGYRWDETAKLDRFYGQPVKPTSLSLDDGDTANDISAVYGNWNAGMTLYERSTLDIMVFMETDPGYITFYAEGRYVQVVNLATAFSALKTAA